jgi:hypothetical protein
MTTLREAAQRAMKSLEDAIKVWKEEMEFRSCIDASDEWLESYAALREALSEPEQEPVAWLGFNPRTGAPEIANDMPAPSVMRDFKMRPLVYGDTSTPPQRKPIDAKTLWEMWVESPSDVLRFARAIERAHGIGGKE